jgi:hypothetical protein
MLTIKPLSESEAAKSAKNPNLWAGWLRAEILTAHETQSRRGNPMVAVRLAVLNGAEVRELSDWLTGSERFAAKVRHAAEAVGKLAEYEAGAIAAEDFLGKTVQVRLEVEKSRGGFPARSVIVDYRPDTAASVVHFPSAE